MLSYSDEMTIEKAKQMSALELAFIGDAVYEIYVRDYAINNDQTKKTNVLQNMTASVVKASSQSFSLEKLIDELTAEELYMYKRGKNSNPHSVPKNQTILDYKKATGFETLIGYLYVTGQKERLNYIANKAIAIVVERNEEKRQENG